MVTKEVTILECDLCDHTAEPNIKKQYPLGWASIEIKGLTFNNQGTVDQIKMELCPKCTQAVLKTINERSE